MHIMKTVNLVKRLWEMGFEPKSFCPPGRHGNQYVSVMVKREKMLDLPEGWTSTDFDHDELTLVWWPQTDWHKELGKRQNFINSGDDAAQGD